MQFTPIRELGPEGLGRGAGEEEEVDYIVFLATLGTAGVVSDLDFV